MLSKRRFFILILTVLMLIVLTSSSAFALSLTVSDSSHPIDSNKVMYLGNDVDFSITLTATDIQMTLDWSFNGDESDIKNFQLIPSGNTVTLTGTLEEDTVRLSPLTIVATDFDPNEIYPPSTAIYSLSLARDLDYNEIGDSTTKIVPNFDFDYYDNEYPVIVIPAGTDFSYSVTVQNPDTSKGSVYWRAWYGTESIHADKPDYFEGSGNTFTVSKTMPTNAASRYYVAVVLYYLTDTGLTDSGVRLNLYVDTDNTRKENARLHVAMVEEVPEDYKTEDLLQKLANNASINRSDIQWLPADAIDTSEPQEPTQSMRDQVAKDSYQFAAKLNTLKVTEDGYYAFQVTVSDDLVGTKVSDLKLYYADEDEFSSASASLAFFGLMPAINGITGSLEVSNMLGVKLDTLPKQFLATMFLSASKSITVYIVRILLLLLGGCNISIGIASALITGIVAVKFFKKRK